MNTLWTHFRRLVMSVMLMAMASFVFHGGALAGFHQHDQRSPACQATASLEHGHQTGGHVHQVSHEHGDEVAHHHALADAVDEVTPDGSTADSGAQAPCCASACPIALAVLSLNAISAPMTLALSLVPGSQRGSGIDPGHLKRPPRPVSIA